MDKLPPEIIANVAAYCPAGRRSESEPCLAPYALISKQWQQVVERRIFSSLEIMSSEIKVFKTIFGAEKDRSLRRSALRRLRYSIESIPGIAEALSSSSKSERATVRQRNTDAALQSLKELYTTLDSWSINRSMTLEISLPRETSLPTGSMKTVPGTQLIKEFVIDSRALRTTALLTPIASQMIGLQEVQWQLDDWDKTMNSVSRRKKRYAQFLQPVQSSTKLVLWPSLARLEINFSLVAADGGWHFERDPNPGSDDGESSESSEEEEEEEDEDLVSRRIRMEQLHSAQEEEAKITNFEDEFDLELARGNDDPNDTEITDAFRIWPSKKLEFMLMNMARTAAQMPAMRVFTAGANMPFCAMHQRFEFFYLDSGKSHADCLWDFTHDSKHRHQRRLYWRVPGSWRMNEELEQAWRDVLGEDGVIDYHDWYGEA
ncbi:hypothetical protein KCU92_g8439, partial [Aureobasidium melanogenum]